MRYHSKVTRMELPNQAASMAAMLLSAAASITAAGTSCAAGGSLMNFVIRYGWLRSRGDGAELLASFRHIEGERAGDGGVHCSALTIADIGMTSPRNFPAAVNWPTRHFPQPERDGLPLSSPLPQSTSI